MEPIMGKEDLEQVLAIERASFTMPWSQNLFLAEFRNRPVALMLVALEDGTERKIAGYIVSWVVVDELHILDLAVRSDVRRRGVARSLVLASLRMAFAKGARRAFLEVRESNQAALLLYEGMGFERTQVRLEYYDTPVESAVVMVLETAAMEHLLSPETPPSRASGPS